MDAKGGGLQGDEDDDASMGGPLDTLSEHLTLAREYALLGNYDTAIIFFEGVLAQINK